MQLHVDFGHDNRLTSYHSGNCFFEAVVQRTFQRPDILPVGTHVRVRSDCKTDQQTRVVEISPGVRVETASAPNERHLVRGSLLQMHLKPAYGPVTSFNKIGEVIVLKALTDSPVDDSTGAAHRASHLNDYNFLDSQSPPAGPGSPPEFPLNDVVVTYRDSRQPGRLFRAFFQSSTWRVRAEEVSGSGRRMPAVINDAFAQTETWISDQTATYAIQMTGYETRVGKVVPYRKPIFETQGSSYIAGLACTECHVRSEVPTLPHAQVCMTSDGVVLRRSYPDGHRTEAVAVDYKLVSREQVTVPEAYRPQMP